MWLYELYALLSVGEDKHGLIQNEGLLLIHQLLTLNRNNQTSVDIHGPQRMNMILMNTSPYNTTIIVAFVNLQNLFPTWNGTQSAQMEIKETSALKTKENKSGKKIIETNAHTN